MATARADSGVEASSQSRGQPDWAAVVPKAVDTEDAVGERRCKEMWEKMYRLAGMSTASEEERRMLRAGVYYYAALNGTSREGEYAGDIVLTNGKKVSASIIPNATGTMLIRKFFRANMAESYDFFKRSQCMLTNDRFIAKCATLGISAENAFATADWLTNCPKFTPGEARAHDTALEKSLIRARKSRDNKTLEDVEEQRIDGRLRAQGPVNEGHKIDF